MNLLDVTMVTVGDQYYILTDRMREKCVYSRNGNLGIANVGDTIAEAAFVGYILVGPEQIGYVNGGVTSEGHYNMYEFTDEYMELVNNNEGSCRIEVQEPFVEKFEFKPVLIDNKVVIHL